MAAVTAAAVDSSICQIICFVLGKLQCNATSDNGDNKIGCKATKIDWKVRPTFWPKDICFVNPNTNLTTPEKWSMLFAALSCLLRKDIYKLLSKSEKFVLCVEMMALESSNSDIINQCHALRLLMKQDLGCLKIPWVKEIFVHGLRSFGLPLAETFTGLECTRFLSLYDELEQKCKKAQLPAFLKQLKTFRSMKSLDAESALKVARECLQYKSTRLKRSCPNPVPGISLKRQKASGKRTQNLVIQTTASSIHVPAIQNPVIQTTASSIPAIQNPVMQTTASSTPAIQNPVIQTTASSTHVIQIPVMQTPASTIPAIHNPVMQTTASSIPAIQNPVLQTPASSIPAIQNPIIQTTASSIPAIQNPVMQTTASSIPAIQNPVIQTTASSTHVIQIPVMQTPASSIPAIQIPVLQTPASSILAIQIPVMQTTASSIPAIQSPSIQSTALSLSTVNYPVINRPATPLQTTHSPVMQTGASSTHPIQCPATQTTVLPLPTSQYPGMEMNASQTSTAQYRGMQTTASPTHICVTQMNASPRPILQYPSTSSNASNATVSMTHLRSQSVCTTSVISTQTTSTTSMASPVNTNNHLLSSSGSHRSLIPFDTSSMSLLDQARNTFKDISFPGSNTWTPSHEYCGAFDSQFTLPDLI